MDRKWLKSFSFCDARRLGKLVEHHNPERSNSRECALPGLPRPALDYRLQRQGVNPGDNGKIAPLNWEDPCSGSRRMVDELAKDGSPFGRDRVQNLMHRGG
jgi:hypothetical protein